MADTVEAAQEDSKALPESAKPWHDKLKAYREEIEDKWKDQRTNLDKLYAKERSDSADREYAIFWANIEVLKAAVYARAPVPVVAPRFKQPNPIAAISSEVLERTLVTTFEQSDINGCMQEVRDEYLRYGRGTGWVRLGQHGGAPRIEFDHVSADDFAHHPVRSWRKVRWVAKREWISREKGRERFNESLAQYGKTFDDVPLKRRDENSAVKSKDDQAPVWEIWSLDDNAVIWVNEETDCILDRKEPWLDLSNFWPCPRPAYSTVVPKTLRPVPDIRQYKDQIEEINEYTARIASLSEQLRLKGFYPAGASELGEAIETALKSLDNRAVLVPVSSWASLGGVAPKDMVIWVPVDQVAEVIKSLVELRRVLIDDVYHITGISDIVRGATEGPRKTATEQQLKAQWGSVRIRDRQNALANFAMELTRIAGEITAENFDAQTLQDMSQVQLPTTQQKQQAQAAMQAQQMQQPGMPAPPVDPAAQKILETPTMDEIIAFLQNDRARGFTIEIETDSTIQPDEDAEKQRRIEFTTAIGGLLNQALPAVQAAPAVMGPFVAEVLKFVAQGFRAGRTLEGAIEQLSQNMAQMGQQAQQPDPKVEAEKAKAEAAKEKAKLDVGVAREKANIEMQTMQAEAVQGQQKLALDEQRLKLDAQRMAMQQAMPQPMPRTN